jgi:hypothetical protein
MGSEWAFGCAVKVWGGRRSEVGGQSRDEVEAGSQDRAGGCWQAGREARHALHSMPTEFAANHAIASK